jgi:hypothetical protein
LGFITTIGLIPCDNCGDKELQDRAESAYREFRKLRTEKTAANWHLKYLRAIRNWLSPKPSFETLKPTLVDVGRVHFVGVWDTVDAYGGPIEEITRAIDYWYWPLTMADRFMSGKIQRACHALALEDERDAFKPVLWDDRYVKSDGKLYAMKHGWTPPSAPSLAKIDEERLSQVWFVGVHSDVGGGYPQDGLSFVTLEWMIDRARVYGLALLDLPLSLLLVQVNALDRLNDSRKGFASYYRYKPRNLTDIYKLPPYKLSVGEDWRRIKRLWKEIDDPEDEVVHDLAEEKLPDGSFAKPALEKRPAPKIHQAVFTRIHDGTDAYSPIVLPEDYCVTDKAGGIAANSREPAARASARWRRQEMVWNWVWSRRIVYFSTMLFLALLLFLPLFQKWAMAGWGTGSPAAFLIPLIDILAAFLPGLAKPWLDAFKAGPEQFLALALAAGILTSIGSGLQVRVRDLMRPIWRDKETEAPEPSGGIFRLRNSGRYKASYYVLTHWFLPSIFAFLIFLLLVYAAVVVVSFVNRIAFGAMEASGYICTGSSVTPVTGRQTASGEFWTGELCHATGLSVTRDKTYRVTLTIPPAATPDDQKKGPWKDSTIPTNPRGFGLGKKEAPWHMPLLVPFRRMIWSNWFATVVRVGPAGFGEHVLDMKPDGDPCGCVETESGSYSGTFKPGKDGEVFLFVNDAAVIWSNRFYDNNRGSAAITIEPVPD